MPLVKATLELEIQSILTEMRAKTEVSDEIFAEKLATAIDNYIKTGIVTTTGTATAQTGIIT